MISSEVQRTLVKSPPELWAELSDPAALARHLGELGEIRITRTDPEKLVEWEAEGTKGTVAIKPSGWGTKVTLSVSRELPATPAEDQGEADEPVAEQAAEAAPEDSDEHLPSAESEDSCAEASAAEEAPSPAVAELDVWASQEAEQADQPSVTAADARVADEAVEVPEPRRGFLARLFGRRRKHSEPLETASAPEQVSDPAAAPEPPLQEQASNEPTPVDEPTTAETVGEPQPEPAAQEDLAADPQSEQPSPEPAADLGAELEQAEEAAADEVTAVLTGMLDRLGAAHHRPFSRS